MCKFDWAQDKYSCYRALGEKAIWLLVGKLEIYKMKPVANETERVLYSVWDRSWNLINVSFIPIHSECLSVLAVIPDDLIITNVLNNTKYNENEFVAESVAYSWPVAIETTERKVYVYFLFFIIVQFWKMYVYTSLALCVVYFEI